MCQISQFRGGNIQSQFPVDFWSEETADFTQKFSGILMSLQFILIQGQPYDGNRCGISPRPCFTLKMETLEGLFPQVAQYMNSGSLSEICRKSSCHFRILTNLRAVQLGQKLLGDAAGYLKTFALYYVSLDSNSIRNLFKRSFI